MLKEGKLDLGSFRGRNPLKKLKSRKEIEREIYLQGYALGIESKLRLANLERRKYEIFEIIRDLEREGVISKEEAENSFLRGYRVGEKDGEEIVSREARGKFSEIVEKAFEMGGEVAGKILVVNLPKSAENPKEVIFELVDTIFPILDYIAFSEEEFSEELIENLREVLLPFYWFLVENDFYYLLRALRSYWEAIDDTFGMPLPMGG